jgi:hydrogenase maturation protein HypF
MTGNDHAPVPRQSSSTSENCRMEAAIIAKRIEIHGIVQGVGFRPFVYQLAKAHHLAGEVSNTAAGVLIFIEGTPDQIAGFCRDIEKQPPPLSRITAVSDRRETPRGFLNFSIISSRTESERSTLISPDTAVCEDCLLEMFDPADRRFRYPFINCTNCGPRYTIISDIPYDRPHTSMKHFEMCEKCRAEYENPMNRRFHAQPNACAVCGPAVTLLDRDGKAVSCTDPIAAAAAQLKKGDIVAVKGLGGFHLAVDALQPAAVAALRSRKHREEKPFALMSPDLKTIRRFACLDPVNEALLTSIHRPIVLLPKKENHPLADAVSPRNRYFGVMLPYAPLHYLLIRQRGFIALVMTSGNLSEEPIAIDNQDALERLSSIADFFLLHNRDIYLRSDDSIVRTTADETRFIRRSRGYVPVPVFLRHALPPILGCGAALKNTICLTKENRAFISQHIGDMENLATYEFFSMTVDHLKRILDIRPEIIAFDLHPDYLSTRYAETQDGMKKVRVQHHHAHIVSCMAENRLDGPVIGLSFDGTGYGSDGKIWGGEVLIAEARDFTRVAHLSYIPMPGSASAIREPWRMAISYLYHAYGESFQDLPLPVLADIPEERQQVIVQMIRCRLNTPETSSLGRLFDGVAAIAGLRKSVCFEGQAAMELEMAADGLSKDVYEYGWTSGECKQVALEPMIRAVVNDLCDGRPVPDVSARFHATIVALFTELCLELREQHQLRRIALSGGVFQNALLLEGFVRSLTAAGFDVFTHREVPANDGGLSLGQAVAAAAMAAR